MPAYWFFDVRAFLDQEKVEAYKAGVLPCVARHGGRYLALGGPVEVAEGDWAPVTPVIIEFADMAAARAWYESDDYRSLKALRLAGTVSRGVLIEGIGPAGPAAAAAPG